MGGGPGQQAEVSVERVVAFGSVDRFGGHEAGGYAWRTRDAAGRTYGRLGMGGIGICFYCSREAPYALDRRPSRTLVVPPRQRLEHTQHAQPLAFAPNQRSVSCRPHLNQTLCRLKNKPAVAACARIAGHAISHSDMFIGMQFARR